MSKVHLCFWSALRLPGKEGVNTHPTQNPVQYTKGPGDKGGCKACSYLGGNEGRAG